MNKTIVLGIVTVALLIIGSSVIAWHVVDAEDECPISFKLLSNHVNCAQEVEQNARINTLESHVSSRVEAAIHNNDATRVGVFYRDLNSRKWFGVNELDPFTPASLLKLPLVIAYYRLAEIDSAILDKALPYELHVDTGLASESHLEDKSLYPVATLIQQVLVHSDNDATITLANNIAESYEMSVFYDLGVTSPNHDADALSPKTYGAIFRALYNASYLQAKYSEEMLETMSHAAFTEGLVAGVPHGTTVSHKFGYRIKEDGSQELHDCGIIYHPESPFILCLMTEGKDPNQLKHVIADITRSVWESI